MHDENITQMLYYYFMNITYQELEKNHTHIETNWTLLWPRILIYNTDNDHFCYNILTNRKVFLSVANSNNNNVFLLAWWLTTCMYCCASHSWIINRLMNDTSTKYRPTLISIWSTCCLFILLWAVSSPLYSLLLVGKRDCNY